MLFDGCCSLDERTVQIILLYTVTLSFIALVAFVCLLIVDPRRWR